MDLLTESPAGWTVGVLYPAGRLSEYSNSANNLISGTLGSYSQNQSTSAELEEL